MEMWLHTPLSLDLALGCGNSATSGAIPRRNWPSAPDIVKLAKALSVKPGELFVDFS
jgi:hypothetical protein